MKSWLACCLLGLALNAQALPGFEAVRSAHRPSEAWLLDRNGERLHTLRIDKRVRRLPWVSLEALSPAMQEALIASEDKRFYQHGGADFDRRASAVYRETPDDKRTVKLRDGEVHFPSADRLFPFLPIKP